MIQTLDLLFPAASSTWKTTTLFFLGYPIWWGEAPRIINTFLEAYNFSGKTIIPFCTSGGSSINSNAAELESLTEGATWLDGQRFNRTSTREEMTEWINALNLGLQTA